MKVLELEINNVRGIRSLHLKPNGKNLAIWGPNGSGKSAVVDALDFLLTGRISRLTGKGTGGITLAKHGPHIDYVEKLDEVTVRAIIKLPGGGDPIELQRCMAQPSTLKCAPKSKVLLEPTMTLAKRGQHVLSRREILKYITAEASTRAQEIQDLLNVTEVENIRKAFVKVQNETERDLESAGRSLEAARAAVNSTIQADNYNLETVLQSVNANRGVLGGQPLRVPSSRELKTGLTAPTVTADKQAINVTLLEGDLTALRNSISEATLDGIAKHDEQLRALLSTVRSDPTLWQALSRQELTRLGLKLIQEDGRCPLCDTPWPPGKLRDYLEQRSSAAQMAAEYQKGISALASALANTLNRSVASLQRITSAVQLMGLADDLKALQLWNSNLKILLSITADPIEKHPGEDLKWDQVRQMLAPIGTGDLLDRIQVEARTRYPEATPEQTAWDTLTRLEENLKALELRDFELGHAQVSCSRASILTESFQNARDTILGKLYDSIKDRFVELYRHVHEIDEGGFTANIKPDGPSLNFEVDFYGRGAHPPHALHSEGHQDSMGLCLYLALAERLTKGVIDVLILDDVVMSVDAEHRRRVCDLLATYFPDRQFIITTHDRTWANQLRTEGVVNTQGMYEFYNWSIDTGPRVCHEMDMWQRIEEDLQKNDVPSAAARLRRGSEQFFATACDALQATVTYKTNGRWELGDFLPSAMGQYRRLLKQAKNAAQSWADSDQHGMFQELDSTAGQIFVRSNAEEWAVNANVHYNKWADFAVADFRPVVEAFQDLYRLYTCTNCGGLLRLTVTGMTAANLRCNCGKVNWNLVEKGKTS